MYVYVCFLKTSLCAIPLVHVCMSVIIRYCPELRDDQLLRLVSAAGSSLRQVDLGWCQLLSDDALSALARHCPRLRALRLGWAGEGITDQGILEIANHCTDLTLVHTYMHTCAYIHTHTHSSSIHSTYIKTYST